jgi:hypothetical protein
MLGEGPHTSDPGLNPPQHPISDLVQRDVEGLSKIAARLTARFAQLLNGVLRRNPRSGLPGSSTR